MVVYDPGILRLGLPKGRMQEGVFRLLADAGIRLHAGARAYRPTVSLPNFEAKILKPHNIIEMLAAGSRDLGFAGADWVAEKRADLVELLDTGLDPVKLVVAAPKEQVVDGRFEAGGREVVVASEYERLAIDWIERQPFAARFVRSYGATEVFPPEDADIIIDNTATGATLRANGLAVFDVVMSSSTRVYAHRGAYDDPARRREIDRLVLLLESVLEARRRVMVEVNVAGDRLEELTSKLPCMRHPTVSPLHGEQGFAVKIAVPRDQLPQVIHDLKEHGGTDIVVSAIQQIVR
jgi:ATP phosphoribosyltransferase